MGTEATPSPLSALGNALHLPSLIQPPPQGTGTGTANWDPQLGTERFGRTRTAIRIIASPALTYFYIAAGCFLIILAVMYCLGKKRKSNEEYVSIVVRVVAGIGITLTVPPLYSDLNDNFLGSPWLIPVVMLGYFVGTYISHG